MIVILQILIAFLSVVLAGIFLSLPILSGYTLQIFAVLVIGFIIVNRLSRRAEIDYKIMLEKKSLIFAWQLFFCGAAIFLLVGSTGGFGSWLFPLLFLYFFFLILANGWLVTLLNFVLVLGLLYYQTPNFGTADYGPLLSLVVFLPIAFFAQKYYQQFLKEQEELRLEREKITYYNLYAEKQQGELLTRGKQVTNKAVESSNLASFLETLIPQLDEVQKESRFPENQLVVSAKLTKIGLALRQILKNQK